MEIRVIDKGTYILHVVLINYFMKVNIFYDTQFCFYFNERLKNGVFFFLECAILFFFLRVIITCTYLHEYRYEVVGIIHDSLNF